MTANQFRKLALSLPESWKARMSTTQTSASETESSQPWVIQMSDGAWLGYAGPTGGTSSLCAGNLPPSGGCVGSQWQHRRVAISRQSCVASPCDPAGLGKSCPAHGRKRSGQAAERAIFRLARCSGISVSRRGFAGNLQASLRAAKVARMAMMAAIENAVAAGKLIESSAANIRRTLASTNSPIASQSIAELVEAGKWTELNDRFYRIARLWHGWHSRANDRQNRDQGGAAGRLTNSAGRSFPASAPTR